MDLGLKFNLMEVVDNPEIPGEDYSERLRRAYELDANVFNKRPDLVKVTLRSGETQIVASVNFSFGQCDCCSKFDVADIIKFELFELDLGTNNLKEI